MSDCKKLTKEQIASELYNSNYGEYLIYGAAIAIRGLAKENGTSDTNIIDKLIYEYDNLERDVSCILKAHKELTKMVE